MYNIYLVFAYGLAWAIFTFYAWVIYRRQQRLERQLQELKSSAIANADPRA
jgi:hypothetical protein